MKYEHIVAVGALGGVGVVASLVERQKIHENSVALKEAETALEVALSSPDTTTLTQLQQLKWNVVEVAQAIDYGDSETFFKLATAMLIVSGVLFVSKKFLTPIDD